MMPRSSHKQNSFLGFGLVLILMLVASQAWAGDAVSLRFKFKPGDKQVYRMTMAQNMEVETDLAPGMTQKVDIKIDTDMYQKVLTQQGAGAELEVGPSVANMLKVIDALQFDAAAIGEFRSNSGERIPW